MKCSNNEQQSNTHPKTVPRTVIVCSNFLFHVKYYKYIQQSNRVWNMYVILGYGIRKDNMSTKPK